MLAILNSLNAHNFPIFQPILMIFVSKFMVRRVLYDKTYLSLGLLSPLKEGLPSLKTACASCMLGTPQNLVIFYTSLKPRHRRTSTIVIVGR